MFELKLCYVFKEKKTKTNTQKKNEIKMKNLIELKIYITIKREVYVYIGERGDKRRLSLVDTVFI